VLVDRPGRAVVTDFGLARTASAASSTHTSVLAGTPAYMAPEQPDGTPADARTDQYAFAVMVHEALTGARPRPRNVASAALPNPLRAILSRALADDPAQRYPSLPALLDAIAKAKPSARRWPILAGAAVLVGGGAVAVSFIVSSRSPEDASEPIALGEPPPIREPIREPIHAPTATVDAGEIVVDATVQQPPAAPRPKTVAATRPEALRDAGVDASVAAVTPAKRVSDRDLPVPRLGETVNKKNLLGKRITTLAEAEAEFTHGLCQLPTMPKVNEYSQPVDWGKVTRVADVVAKHTKHGATDLRLYEIAGQRKRYLIDSHWGAALHGELGAKVGDVVAICPRGDVNDEYELPEGWQGPITRHHVVVRVGGPPDRRGLSLISWSNINATNTDHTWPYGDRMLIYGRTGGQLNSGKYMMSGWQLEVDAATKNPLDLHRGAWIVVEKPRWEPYGKSRDGTERTIVVLHAAEMYATLFPPAP
jgi:hypothetical protein